MAPPVLPPRPLSRRTLLRSAGLLAAGGAGAAAVTGLAGCGTGVPAGVTGAGASKATLTYWNLFSGGDGIRMVAMEDAYKKSHPNVSLESSTLAWGAPYYTKLALATLGGRPPDVAISHVSRVPTLAEAGLLEPLDEAVLARHGLTADKFTPAAWAKAHVGGKLYAIPLDTHPFVLYYNTVVCKKAGLLRPDGRLKSLNGPTLFAEALRAAKKVTGQYGGVVNINADPSTCWRWFSSLYWQAGGDVVTHNGTTVDLNHDKAMKVLRYQQELTVGKNLMPKNIDGNGVTSLFSSGKAGLLLDGEWQVTTYEQAKLPFDMTPIPNIFGGKYVCWADSHTFVLPTNPKRTPARRDFDLDFVRYLLGQSLTWAKGGHVPAWLPIQTSTAYKELKPMSHYVAAAEHARYDPAAWYSGAGSDFETVVGSAVAAVESGGLSPEAGLAQIRSGVTHYAHIKPPVA